MKHTIPYLHFNGNCKEAMEFYAAALGGELQTTPYGDKSETPDRIMHARLTVGGEVFVMASDVPPSFDLNAGNNFYISLSCDHADEVDKLHPTLSEGGSVKMAPQNMFWGAYFSMFVDQFGVGWMLDAETRQ